MRFDLTNASYRVLRRAANIRLSVSPSLFSGISAATLLISLFEEEECRAAVWLAEAGLSLDLFHLRFGIEEPLTSLPVDAMSSGEDGENRHVNQYGEKKVRSGIRFFFDDMPVAIGRISAELEASLEVVSQRLARRESTLFPMVSLPTEHLLMAVVLENGDVGSWLRDNGFDAAELFGRIEGIGMSQATVDSTPTGSPLDMPFEDEPEYSIKTKNIEAKNTEAQNFKAWCENEHDHGGHGPETDPRLYRLIDAVINRAREAIRVIEDFARFVLDDEPLTRQLKNFRHEFRETTQIFCHRSRLAARNTPGDVGTEIEGGGEYRRASPHDVLSANFARLQESLRSLEEYSKLVAPEAAKSCEQLRYRCYSLHKLVFLAEPEARQEPKQNGIEQPGNIFDAKKILADARLYTLVDCRDDEKSFSDIVSALVEGGVDIVQLRDKKADDRTLLARAEILKRIIAASERSVLFVMNDRPDLARLAGADGVHVGQEELSVENVRKIVGTCMLVGVSTHYINQVHQAVADGADYVGAGPVFASSTKAFDRPAGLDFLKQVVTETAMPVFAIGGVSPDNLDDVLATGVKRIAVGAALTEAVDPRSATEQLCKRLYGEAVEYEGE